MALLRVEQGAGPSFFSISSLQWKKEKKRWAYMFILSPGLANQIRSSSSLGGRFSEQR